MELQGNLKATVWILQIVAIYLLLHIERGEGTSLNICSSIYKTSTEGVVHSPDFPANTDASACECNVTSGRPTDVVFDVHFVSTDITDADSSRCSPGLVMAGIRLCPEMLDEQTPMQGYQNTSFTFVLGGDDDQIQLRLENRGQVDFRLQILFSALYNRNVRVECGEYDAAVLPMVGASSGGGDDGGGLTGSEIAALVIGLLFIVAIIAVIIACYMHWKKTKQEQAGDKNLDRSRDNYDETRGDNPGYEATVTPKSSVYNISIDESFSVERGPEASMENPVIAGHGLTLPFKYSQVSLASGQSQPTGKQPLNNNTNTPSRNNTPAEHRKHPDNNTNQSNSHDSSPTDDSPGEKERPKNVTFLNPAYNNPERPSDVIVPEYVEKQQATPNSHEPTLNPLRQTASNAEDEPKRALETDIDEPDDTDHIPETDDPEADEPAPYENLPPGAIQPKQQQPLSSTPQNHRRPVQPPESPAEHQYKPIDPNDPNNPYTNPSPIPRPNSTTPVPTPTPASGRSTPASGRSTPVARPASTTPTPTDSGRSTPVYLPPHLRHSPYSKPQQQLPYDHKFLASRGASPLAMPYTSPVIPLSMHNKPFNVSSESIPYIDASGYSLHNFRK